jgi:hypothetical protein
MDSVPFVVKLVAADAVAMAILVLVMAAYAIGALWYAVRRVWARVRLARDVRNLEFGSCDGLPRRRIRYLVDELWSIDDPARMD